MRLQNIVLTDLLNDRLIAYEELERVMNKKDKIGESVTKIKYFLKQIARLNAMIDEWQDIMNSDQTTDLDKFAEELNKNRNNG